MPDTITVNDLRKILHHQKDVVDDALSLLHSGDFLGACAAITLTNAVVSGAVTQYMLQSELRVCQTEI